MKPEAAGLDPVASHEGVAWAFSNLSNEYSWAGEPAERIRALESAVLVCEVRVVDGVATAQEIRDLPLLLDNLATGLLDVSDLDAAMAASSRAIAVDEEVFRCGARSQVDYPAILEALRGTRVAIQARVSTS